MAQSLCYNDGILFASLLYSCVDLHWEWASFDNCSKPVHHWLLTSYACVIGFRAMHLLGTRSSPGAGELDPNGFADPAGTFLLDLRQKGAVPRTLTVLTWTVALPFFVLWTGLGSSWLWDVMQKTPQCMPSQTHLWFAGCWLALCYVWIFVHLALGAVAWTLERRVRLAEGELRAIEDDDVRDRWGQVSQISGYQELEGGRSTGSGLKPAEIHALPCETALGSDLECSICINNFQKGDMVRRLPECGHTFHKSCIDLWLLRCADCPLCKRSVRKVYVV